MKKHIALLCLCMLCLCSKVMAQKIWTLKECIAYGRENSFGAIENTILNAAYKEDRKGIAASYLPQYNFVANGSYTANSTSYLWAPNAGLEINAIVYSGSRRKQELQKADLVIAQSEYTIAMAQNNVEMQVLYAYAEALTKKELYKVCEDFYKKALQLHFELSTAKILTETDDCFFNALLQQDSQEIQQLQQQYAIALLKIRQTINLYDVPDFEIEEMPLFEPTYITLAEAFPKAILADPGISINQLDIDIAEKNSAIAKSFLLPTISLQYTPFYELNKPGLQHYAGLRISVPIFNRNAQKAAIGRAAINRDYQEKQLENQKETLFNAVVLILNELENKQALYKSSSQTLSMTTLLLNDSQERLKHQTTNCEAYLAIRNWSKQNAMQTVMLKYEAITQAKLLDFYTGITL